VRAGFSREKRSLEPQNKSRKAGLFGRASSETTQGRRVVLRGPHRKPTSPLGTDWA